MLGNTNDKCIIQGDVANSKPWLTDGGGKGRVSPGGTDVCGEKKKRICGPRGNGAGAAGIFLWYVVGILRMEGRKISVKNTKMCINY